LSAAGRLLARQELAGVARLRLGDRLGRACGHDLAAAVAAFGPGSMIRSAVLMTSRRIA